MKITFQPWNTKQTVKKAEMKTGIQFVSWSRRRSGINDNGEGELMKNLKIEIRTCFDCPFFTYESFWVFCEKNGTGYKLSGKENVVEYGQSFMFNTCPLPDIKEKP